MHSKGIGLDQVFHQDCSQVVINFDLNLMPAERKDSPDLSKQVKLYSVICLAQESVNQSSDFLQSVNCFLSRQSTKMQPSEKPALRESPLGLKSKKVYS